MANPFQALAQEEYSQNPQSGQKNPYSNPFEQFAREEDEEGFLKSAVRTALQIPQGYLEGTQGGIAASIWQLLGQGEVLDPEEIDRVREISQREGIPFDEDAYMEAAQRALGTVPTVSNAASKIEEKWGVPLEPKTRAQKGLRFLSLASKAAPKDYTFRGMNTSLPKPVLGAGIAGTKEVLQESGVPEPFAELASFGVIKPTTSGAGKFSLTKEKPSGLPERGFEKLNEPTEVPAKKLQQISDKLETDFRDVSNKIIKESPIGETAENLKNDPRFKNESRQLLNQAQVLADETPGTLPTNIYKKELVELSTNQIKGFALNEYKKNYLKFMKEAIQDVLPENMTYGELVEQYRDNNRSLGEYFEPGSSKALNRAKKDVLLDQNRAIANVLEESNPELSSVFKEGNARWTKIMDAEAVDNFVTEMFPEGKKVDFKHMKDLFNDPNYQRIFKRALGEEGAKAFEGAVEDMLTAEKPYKMLRTAQGNGLEDVLKTGMVYILHPNIGYGKAAIDLVKGSYRTLFNYTLDKPQIGVSFTKAVKELNKGNLKAAEEGFKAVKAEIEGATKQTSGEANTAPRNKTIEVEPLKAERAPDSEQKKVANIAKFNEKKKRELQQPKLIEYKPKPIEK